MYDDYVVTMDGLEQTVEVKWVPFILVCVFARAMDSNSGGWIVMSLCPCSRRRYFRCLSQQQASREATSA
jgi:hypothetical protein